MNTQFYPIVICVVMLSLGLSLTLADFRRVVDIPRPVIVALLCQTLLIPVLCFLIAKLFALPPVFAVGLMLISASPGGTMANIISHLVDGDLALNLTLTAINSVLSIVTLPVVVVLSMTAFMGEARAIPLQYVKVVEVISLILGPVAVGMTIRHFGPSLADRLRTPVKWLAGLFLVAITLVALVTGWGMLTRHFRELLAAIILLGSISLMIGYTVPRLMRLGRRQAIAISLEIGLHNAALAITIASSPQLLGNSDMAVPGALYGILIPFVAAAFIFLTRQTGGQSQTVLRNASE